MDDGVPSIPQTVIQSLLSASNSSMLENALQRLIEIAKTAHGRAELVSKDIGPSALELCQALYHPSSNQVLLLSLKLLRNLCAGEIRNQDLFIELDGVRIIYTLISSIQFLSGLDYDILCMGLQLLGNVALAGAEHQHAIWQGLFPSKFCKMAEVRSRQICDPLCMVIYTCSESSDALTAELCSDSGLPIILEIIRTVSKVGFKENWIKLLLSRVFLEGLHFASIFSKLHPVSAATGCGDIMTKLDYFAAEQAFLLGILSEILNEQISDIVVSNDFALCVLKILRTAVKDIDCGPISKSGLPTGCINVDVSGYCLAILRDICAGGSLAGVQEGGLFDVVDMLMSSGLIEFLLSLLRELEPPSTIRKGLKQGGSSNERCSKPSKQCPYRGFRRDIVGILGNCAYRRKHVQDEIRQKDGILLLLQQCVVDEDNPFLREWGIWSVRNLMEANVENQKLVADMEMQGTVDVPEVAGLGLRVEMDPKTRRAKLVNV